jgi:hypothetical protein
MAENKSIKFWLIAATVAVLLLLLQMTPFALLPLKQSGFVEGLAFSLCIALAVVWLSRRSIGSSPPDNQEAKRAKKERS